MDLLMLVVLILVIASPILLALAAILAVLAYIWPKAGWARICNRPIGPTISSPSPTREEILFVIAKWSWIASFFLVAFLASLPLGFYVPLFLSTGGWVIVLIAEAMGTLVSFLEIILVSLRLLDARPTPPPQSDEQNLIRSRTA